MAPRVRFLEVTDRRTRVAVSSAFFVNAFTFTTFLPRYPEIRVSLELTNLMFGIAVAAFPAGALLSGLAAAPIVRRWGSRNVSAISASVLALCIYATTIGGEWIWLAAALGLAGVCDSLADVSQNSHALKLEGRYGRSLLSSFHAVWSCGAVVGALFGAYTLAYDWSIELHLGISVLLAVCLSVGGRSYFMRGEEFVDNDPKHSSGSKKIHARLNFPFGSLFAICVIALAAVIVEDAAATWGAVLLREFVGATGGILALVVVSVQGSQILGRLIGDRLIDRFGARVIVQYGAILALIGMGLALIPQTTPTVLLGFGLAGLGVSTMVPTAMQIADRLQGIRAGFGVSVVAWSTRFGFLALPPLVGLIADASSVRLGLSVVPIVLLFSLLVTRVLPRRRVDATN